MGLTKAGLNRGVVLFLSGLNRRILLYLMIILGYFFPVLHKNIRCGCSLEAPCQGSSKEYPCLMEK